MALFNRSCLVIAMLLAILSQQCWSQILDQHRVDSLQQVLQNSSGNAERARHYSLIGYLYKQANADSANLLCNQGLHIAKASNDIQAERYALYIMGSLKGYESKFDSARSFYNSGLALPNPEKDRNRVAAIYRELGQIYTKLTMYDRADKALNNAVKFYAGLDTMHKDYGLLLNRISVNSYYKSDYDRSISESIRSLNVCEHIRDTIGMANAYLVLGAGYSILRIYDDALEMYNKAQVIWQNLGNKDRMAATLNRIGHVYQITGDYENALKNFEAALNLRIEQKDSFFMPTVIMNIGVIHQNFYHDNKTALEYYYRALGLDILNNNPNGIIVEKLNIGKTLVKEGLINEGLDTMTSAMALADTIGSAERRLIALQSFSEIYEHLESFKKAFYYEKLRASLEDSLSTAKYKDRLANFKAELDFSDREHKIALLDEQNKLKDARIANNTRLIVAILIVIVLLVALVWALFRSNRQKQQSNLRIQKEKDIVEQQKTELSRINDSLKLQKEKLEIKALQTQMNPHFIFNSLNSVQRYIASNKPEKAHEYLSMFGKVIRSTLENSDKEFIPLNEELAQLDTYVSLEQERVEHPVSFKIDIAPGIDDYNTNIPPMIIQPFIENAIWHGISPKKSPGKLNLSFIRKEDYLLCTVEDDGVGRQTAKVHDKLKQLTNHVSRGVAITRKRLQTISNDDRDDHVRFIDLTDNYGNATGTKVEILLPLEF